MRWKIFAVSATAFAAAFIFTAFDAQGAAPKGGKGKASGEAPKLLGSWKCLGLNGQGNAIALIFNTNDALVFNGEAASYTLAPGVIRVLVENSGYVDYQYRLSGDSLGVAFPDGSALQCEREAQASSLEASAGGEKMIFGTFCSWSGSSGGGASYSSTERATFDGKGGFSYGSESSFSNKSGMGYGQNAGAGNRGTYRVRGNAIELSFGDGTTAGAQIHFRQSDGSVSEVMYNKKLYGKALCR